MCLISINSIAQNDYNGEQLIQTSNGQNEITFEILDFDSNEPLIGASIFSKELNKVLEQTNVEGKTKVNKLVSNNIRIDYIGYNSYCFKIKDNSIDHIIVRLILSDLDYGTPVVDKKLEKIFPHKSLQAIKDIDSGIVKLYCYSIPTEEQLEFAKQFCFNFIIDNKKSSADKFNYNEEVLNYLDKKYNIQIRTKLSEICWRNIK